MASAVGEGSIAIPFVHRVLTPFKQSFVDRITRITEAGAEGAFKYKVGDRVLSPKGAGVITNGYRSAKLVQYQLKRDEAGLYWSLEEELKQLPPSQ